MNVLITYQAWCTLFGICGIHV